MPKKKGTRRSGDPLSRRIPASSNPSSEAGGLASAAGLSTDALKLPGATLVNLILEVRVARGLTYEQLAEEHLGISRSHLMMLRTGKRTIVNISSRTMKRIAAFLGIPPVVAMLAGGQLGLEDFYQTPEMLQQGLAQAMKFIQRDPDIGPYMPATVFLADEAVQRFIMLLYEKATGRTLIPSRVSLADIVESYKTLEEP